MLEKKFESEDLIKIIEKQDINESISQLHHHIGHFLLLSRIGEVYHINQLDKIKLVIDQIKDEASDKELLIKIDELSEKIDSIILDKYDGDLLKEIQEKKMKFLPKS